MAEKKRKSVSLRPVWSVLICVAIFWAPLSLWGETSAPEPLVVHFGTGDEWPDAAGQAALEDLGLRLKGVAVSKILVEGYSDSSQVRSNASPLYDDNVGLSRRRAENVASLLVKKSGASTDLFAVAGRGREHAVASNATASGRAENRRVEIRVFFEADGDAVNLGGLSAEEPQSVPVSPPEIVAARLKLAHQARTGEIAANEKPGAGTGEAAEGTSPILPAGSDTVTIAQPVASPEAPPVARPASSPAPPSAQPASLTATPSVVPPPQVVSAAPPVMEKPGELLSLSFRDAPLSEVFEMLSLKERVNIVLDQGVSGTISLNLYDVTLDEAMDIIVEAVGCRVERRPHGYAVLPALLESGKHAGKREIRTYRLQYAQPKSVMESLAKHVSANGVVTVIEDRKIIVIEDSAESLARLEAVIHELDRRPRQILIEAKILVIGLTDEEQYGIDWSKLFTAGNPRGTTGKAGIAGLQNVTSGLFVNLTNINISLALAALNSKHRVHTLSAPKLISLEDQEASVMIGDRQGYKVTTTINQVTTESVEFLESGVILKVTPSIDNDGRILMAIHPEVSKGVVTAGIPAQDTTEVTTMLLAENGQTVFIGGLISNDLTHDRNGVPGLSAVPVVGLLFSNLDEKIVNKETVVLITPHLIDTETNALLTSEAAKVETAEKVLAGEKVWTDRVEEHFRNTEAAGERVQPAE